MIDRIVISLLIGVIGGIVVWCLMVLTLVLNQFVPWYFPFGAAIAITGAAMILDYRTRSENE